MRERERERARNLYLSAKKSIYFGHYKNNKI